MHWYQHREGRHKYGHGCPDCEQRRERHAGLEAQIFHGLGAFLGPGTREVPVPSDRRMWLDMLFELPDGFRLGVEYDGAYWHRDKTASDRRKNDAVLDDGLAHFVLRIREHPLEPLSERDVVVPAGAAAPVAVHATLTHLVHLDRLAPYLSPRLDPLAALLFSSPIRLDTAQFVCPACRDVVAHLVRFGPFTDVEWSHRATSSWPHRQRA